MLTKFALCSGQIDKLIKQTFFPLLNDAAAQFLEQLTPLSNCQDGRSILKARLPRLIHHLALLLVFDWQLLAKMYQIQITVNEQLNGDTKSKK